MTKIIGIIPARHQSSRLPGKPLVKIAGKSLIRRTYENAKKSTLLHDLIVATDNVEIFEHVKEFGGEATMTSTNCPTGTDRVAEAYKNEPWLQGADIIVNIQGDEPCLEPGIIDEIATTLLNDPNASMSTALTELKDRSDFDNPNCVKCVRDLNNHALYFSRAPVPFGKTGDWQTSNHYYKHLGIYAYKTDFLLTFVTLKETPLQLAEDLEQIKALEHGYKIKTVVVESKSIGVDTPEDLKKIEELL